MVTRIWAPLLALVVLASAPVPAAAIEPEPEPEIDWSRSGWYASARGVYGFEKFKRKSGSTADNDWGVRIAGGYRWNRWFGVETEFEFMNGFRLEGGALDDIDVDVFFLNLDFKAYPLGGMLGRFQPFLGVGPGWMWTRRTGPGIRSDEDGGFAARFGGGFDVFLTENLALTYDTYWVHGTRDVRQVRYLALGWGFTWKFSPEE